MRFNRITAALFFFAITIGIVVVVVHFSVRALQAIGQQYFLTLPVSNQSDLDRDGIPDYIDDSDGDGIADEVDATPYGESGGSIPKPRMNWGRRTLPKIE